MDKIKTISKAVVGRNALNEEVCVYCGGLLSREYSDDVKNIEYHCDCNAFKRHCSMNMDLAMTNMDFERSDGSEEMYEMYLNSYEHSFKEYQTIDRLIQIDSDCKMIVR